MSISVVSLLLILPVDNSVFTAKSGINDVCLFGWLVVVTVMFFFCFQALFVRLCRELRPPRRTVVIPGIQSLFRLKTKRHNLNARSIFQKKDHNSPQFPKTLSTARSIICSFFEHNREKPKPRLEIKSPQIPGIVYFPATLSSKDVLIFQNLPASKLLPEEQIF